MVLVCDYFCFLKSIAAVAATASVIAAIVTTAAPTIHIGKASDGCTVTVIEWLARALASIICAVSP